MLTPQIISREEERLQYDEYVFWLSKGQCPDCRSQLEFHQRRSGILARLGWYGLDTEAHCPCGFHVIDRETLSGDWITYEIKKAKRGPLTVHVDL